MFESSWDGTWRKTSVYKNRKTWPNRVKGLQTLDRAVSEQSQSVADGTGGAHPRGCIKAPDVLPDRRHFISGKRDKLQLWWRRQTGRGLITLVDDDSCQRTDIWTSLRALWWAAKLSPGTRAVCPCPTTVRLLLSEHTGAVNQPGICLGFADGIINSGIIFCCWYFFFYLLITYFSPIWLKHSWTSTTPVPVH